MTKRCPKSSLEGYRFFLKAHDMKPNTIDKYMRDVGKFLAFIRDGRLDHGAVARYREYLLAITRTPAPIPCWRPLTGI